MLLRFAYREWRIAKIVHIASFAVKSEWRRVALDEFDGQGERVGLAARSAA
ncbi:hypothetical protein [Burkholderia sp. LA-2-3-30-S1-D2]|uniref:hypothetical protein n=1 Tax=Burkholderia sp. LA-2-3-30-S1-D2 TaxID=1637862 RepID=UPI00131EDC10|nr:hypothetical protein [Burkholderia sp. LA-2-3-30-S1-D2]